MIRGRAEIGFVEARSLEPQMNIVLPSEADATVHKDSAVSRAAVNLGEPRLRHRGRARSLIRFGIDRIGGVPQESARGLQLGNDFRRSMFKRLERSDWLAELLADFRIINCHL